LICCCGTKTKRAANRCATFGLAANTNGPAIRLSIHPINLEIHETGLDLAERYGLSTYDALIVASALHIDCDTLWSEDMQEGMTIEKRLRIANPFRAVR
jgi:predicted nucleic acid-binding protein